MAIEIIPKSKIKEISWVNLVLYFLLIIFLVLLLSYFILDIYQKKLNQELSDLEKALIRTDAEKALEDELSIYQKKIEDFGNILNVRQSPLDVFSFLEKTIHPKVWFSNFSFDLEKGTLSLSGQAENPEVIEQQLIIFKKQEMVKNVTLSNFSISKEEKIDFNLQLTFDSPISQ